MGYTIHSSIFALSITLFSFTGHAQLEEASGQGLFSNKIAVNDQVTSTIFDDVLDIRLSGDLRRLMNDREDQEYHPFTITYQDGAQPNSIPVKVRTRGHFRLARGNCTYPPLLLNFAKKKTNADSVFKDQDKIKLVTPCRGDKYVVQEYLVYKLYNLVTPKSFKARLVKVTYEDTVKSKTSEPLFGVLIEEEAQMAKRNNTISIKKTPRRPEQTNKSDFLKMAVFEFLIGNTDWSIQYLQNVKLIAKDSSVLPSTVPYDFDHAGIVRAPYAKPAEQLLLSSTLNRRYRGFCVNDMSEFEEVFAQYNTLKEDIYKVYTECPYLDERYVKSTLKFLDEFYVTINNPKEASAQFLYPCDKNGTGNVVIQGLNRD